MVIDYVGCFERVGELCDKFRKNVEYVFFKKGTAEKANRSLCLHRYYREQFIPIKACVQLCRILKPEFLTDTATASFFYEQVASLEDNEELIELKDFRSCLESVKLAFGIIENERLAFYSAFDEEEKVRINEAIHTHLEGCDYSCVAMSVSAVESRLLKLMCLANPESKQRLEKMTLGQLIEEYIKNKGEYKSVVPEKHEALLQLCNTYRVFSVHPKKQKIKPTVANSILTLSIEFLTDQDTKPEAVKDKLG